MKISEQFWATDFESGFKTNESLQKIETKKWKIFPLLIFQRGKGGSQREGYIYNPLDVHLTSTELDLGNW